MATKYSLQSTDGETLKAGMSKKQQAIALAEKHSLVAYRVVTDSGNVVHEVEAPVEVPSEQPVENLEPEEEDLLGTDENTPANEVEAQDETLFYEFLDFPGNYSIVMAPFAVEIAGAAGVPTKVETFKGELRRRVHFGGTNMDITARVVTLVQQEAQEAHSLLRTWQKDNIEERRGLTDMQRYVQHRDFLAEHGHKVARRVTKNGL